jgi:hypothetical protein
MMPTLDLDFSRSGMVDRISGQNLITFTRASSGTFVDASGTLQTGATDAPRITHDPVTRRCLGLLIEEARTNLLLNSATLSTQNVTVAATAYTLSFTGTGSITRSGVSTGTLSGTGTGEANRVSVTFTPTAGTLTLTVSGTVTNAQLEAGAFATSPIITTGSAATRAADIATITGANFSRWYNQLSGALYAQCLSSSPTSTSGIAAVNDNTSSNRIDIRQQSNSVRGIVNTGGVGQATMIVGTGSNPPANVLFASALSYETNSFAISQDGLSPITDSSGTVPAVSQMRIGMLDAGTSSLNGSITHITYWPRRLSDTILQSLTR